MKKLKAFVAVVLILVMVLSVPAAAQGTGKSYVYNHNAIAHEIPDPYKVVNTVGYDLGMVTPVDMVIRNDKLFILDTGHEDLTNLGEDAGVKHTTRLLVLDNKYELEKEILFYSQENVPYTFTEPRGLWIDEENTIYVTDRLGRKLAMFDEKGMLIRALGKPASAMIAYEENEYLPSKVLTDSLGIIYLIAENDYNGILMMEKDGNFLGYFGSNEVAAGISTVLQNILQVFMTEEQKERTAQSLPTGYSNFCIDEAGAFVFGVRGTTSDMNELIRKINCKGKNVLDYMETFGDIGLTAVGGDWKKTNFNAIAVDNKGFITVFDTTWQRLFQYTPEGNLMYVFGGKGSQEGTFVSGSDLETWGDQLLVLDEVYATVTVMEPTTFGANVRLGETYYSEGDYQASMKPFSDVVTECMNYEFGYQGIGKAYYMQKDYKAAMDAFYLAFDQEDYSMAFKMYRGEVTSALTVPFVIAIVVLIVFAIVWSILKAKGVIKTKKLVLDESGKGKYILHTILHPIEGFEEMRYNKKYSLWIANTAYFFCFFTTVIKSLYSGFIYNGKNAQNYNVVFTIVAVLGGLGLFVLVNWLMSTFLEGKGTLKNVWIYLGYATIPYSATCLVYTLLSNMLTAEESTFLVYLNIFGIGWACVMAFFAIQGVHMYSFKKNIASILVTVFGILVVLFIVFLMFNLFVQFFSFGESIYTEVMYRSVVGFE